MDIDNPHAIVKAALQNGELAKLLLGEPEYRYRSKYSPAPGDTDLTELLAVIYDGLEPEAKSTAKTELEKALYSLCGFYEGIDAISTCILLESVRQSDGRPTLGLPIEDLAHKLQATIQRFGSRLALDRSGAGQNWPDGLLGDLRRLSRNTQRYGGPAFC